MNVQQTRESTVWRVVQRRPQLDARPASTPLLALVTRSTSFAALILLAMSSAEAQSRKQPDLFEVPVIRSSWDDLTEDIKTRDDWRKRRAVLKQRYLELLRDQHKPEKPPLDLQVHEEVVVDGVYRRKLISYGVEAGERAHAYLGIPFDLDGPAPAIVALHGTYKHGKQRVAGLIDNPDKAYLDHLCRRGYIVIAPEHFVSGHRIPAEGLCAGDSTLGRWQLSDVLRGIPRRQTCRYLGCRFERRFDLGEGRRARSFTGIEILGRG